jgi:hypothetical protein
MFRYWQYITNHINGLVFHPFSSRKNPTTAAQTLSLSKKCNHETSTATGRNPKLVHDADMDTNDIAFDFDFLIGFMMGLQNIIVTMDMSHLQSALQKENPDTPTTKTSSTNSDTATTADATYPPKNAQFS